MKSEQRILSSEINKDSHAILIERNALVEEYQSYVDLIVAKLSRKMGLPRSLKDDFISAGLLGLVEAADRFDPTRGTEFRAYAFFRIRGAIIDQIRASCSLTGHGYKIFKALEATHELQANSIPLIQRSAKRSQSKLIKLGHALEFLSKSAIAYKLVTIKEFSQLKVEELKHQEDPEQALNRKRESEKIKRLIATLPEKERMIIEQYYFNDRRFVEVADEYTGLSKSWVSRLHDRALTSLRNKYISRQ